MCSVRWNVINAFFFFVLYYISMYIATLFLQKVKRKLFWNRYDGMIIEFLLWLIIWVRVIYSMICNRSVLEKLLVLELWNQILIEIYTLIEFTEIEAEFLFTDVFSKVTEASYYWCFLKLLTNSVTYLAPRIFKRWASSVLKKSRREFKYVTVDHRRMQSSCSEYIFVYIQ